MRVEHEQAAGGEASSPATAVKAQGIAVLGSHPATVMDAPFDEDWLIYACSPHNVEMRELPRVDEWFEVHVPIADATRAFPYLKALESMPLVWMRDHDALPYFKGGRPYPEKEMKQRFGPFFFTSSIAYILAKAIVDCERHGIRQIGIWGVMQASPNEYAYQRPGIQYFIQRATELGIKVMAPEVSKLFEPPQDQF